TESYRPTRRPPTPTYHRVAAAGTGAPSTPSLARRVPQPGAPSTTSRAPPSTPAGCAEHHEPGPAEYPQPGAPSTSSPPRPRLQRKAPRPLDRLVAPEVLVVVVVAAGPAADFAVVLDELDALDPLHVLEPELVLVAQSHRRAMAVAQRLVVHLVGEHGQLRVHLLDRLGVVVDPAVGPLRDGVEGHPFRLRLGPHQLDDLAHRHAAPLADRRPALDAVMLGDLLVVRQRPQFGQAQLHGVLHQTVDAEPVVAEVVRQ